MLINNEQKQVDKWIIAGLFFLGICLTTGLWGWGHRQRDLNDGAEGQGRAKLREAPPFDLKGADGKSYRLADFKGNAIVLHFWASWCPPCLGEIPNWLEFAARWKGRPVRFVAVSLDKTWGDALKIFPADRAVEPVISVLDSSLKLSEAYGTYQFPETYLLSPDLKIVTKWVGPQDWSLPKITSEIEGALKKIL
ncbi:TlpA disulfide reductase family protein [Bdellovibrionota bacterium FG-1]